MERREFCKLALAAAAAGALPAAAEGQQAGSTATDPIPPALDHITETYAQLCATPADQRSFTAFDGKFLSEKLNNATWRPTGWGDPPALPIAGGSWDGVPMDSPLPDLAGKGPFQPTWDSLLQYDAPEWYRDAKFGIWAHWSPQCVPEAGDWYARNMYMEGSRQYKYHLDHYGPQSRFGYKDLCPQWTLLNWDPDGLIARYKKAGARIFFALANHHDGFDTWASKHQPWNAISIGPHRDVLGVWSAAARKQGLRFGVTVHQHRNWWWFQTSHDADKKGAFAGIPYDGDLFAAAGKNEWWQGVDPQRLYAPKHPYNALPDISYVKNFYDRTRDLVDQHNPDVLYFDNPLLPLGWGGMNIAAYYYNRSRAMNGGKVEGCINIKKVPAKLAKSVIADYERGITSGIMPYAWQSETCIGDWHYYRALYDQPGKYGGYLAPRDVIHWLIDTVSKNGTFILNIPGKPDGTIDSKESTILDRITDWMEPNGEAIYATRPWKTYGEGPSKVTSGSFQGKSVSKLGVKDIRFTRSKNNQVIYAIFLGWPAGEVTIRALGTSSATNPGRIAQVTLLGTGRKVDWKQNSAGLTIKLPKDYQPAADYAASLKVSLA